MRPAGWTESSRAARQRCPRQAVTSRGHGTSPSETYVFVGSIAASAAALAYIAWAYAPEPWRATYYPHRRWVVAVPAFVAVAAAQGVALYVASNFLLAPPPACFSTIADEHAQEPAPSSPRTGADQAIEPIADIGIDRMNHLMFGEWRASFTSKRMDSAEPVVIS